jgi:hypothetical protein
MNINRRIAALEASAPVASGIFHRTRQIAGETLEDAVTAYGREKIGPTDRLIVRQIITPRTRSAGAFQ